MSKRVQTHHGLRKKKQKARGATVKASREKLSMVLKVLQSALTGTPSEDPASKVAMGPTVQHKK